MTSSLDELVSYLLDGQATEPQREHLAALLRSDAAARSSYLEMIAIHSALRNEVGAVVPTKPSQANTIDRNWRRSFVRFIVRPTPLSLTVSAGVMLLLITALAVIAVPEFRARFVSPGEVGTVELVAQLTGELDAVWIEGQTSTKLGSHLAAGRRFQLQGGLAQVTFRSGAVLLLEGPAEFSCDSAAAGTLHHGKLHARTAGETFAVRTNMATIVDLGTEFGVEVEATQRVGVHVFEGLVEVQQDKHAQRLAAGESLIVTADGLHRGAGGEPMAEKFVRRLPPILDVADIIAGGNGQQGRRNAGIDLKTGQLTQQMYGGGCARNAAYLSCEDHPLVDGVFVVAAGETPQQLDAAGHLNNQLGSNTAEAWNSIFTNNDGTVHLHANVGVTLDLHAARQLHGSSVTSFEAVIHSNTAHAGEVRVVLLVDGTEAFSQTIAHGRQLPLRIPLPSNAHYLTLVLTDAGDGLGNDGVLLHRCRLRLSSAS